MKLAIICQRFVERALVREGAEVSLITRSREGDSAAASAPQKL